MKPRVVAFDLDDTLTVSKSKIDPRMAALLADLLTETDVCIISGGTAEQFHRQVLDFLEIDDVRRARLHLMPTCGTRYYRFERGDWREIYAEDFSEADKKRAIDAVTEGAHELGLWEPKPWGDIIEDRGSQITFSALGQTAPPEAKYAWDPDGAKKRALRDYVAGRLPEFEVRGGGSTSVDITRRGIDKAYGMRKLMQYNDLTMDQILFVGDRLDEGGNDRPVMDMGIESIAVHGWKDTADVVEKLLRDWA